MSYFKRAITSVKRRPGKSVILLTLLFILGNLVSGAFSIRQAILNTESNLMSQLPAITTIYLDVDYFHDFRNQVGDSELDWSDLDIEPITIDIIEEIANLDYVKTYDFSLLTTILSRDLYRNFVPSTTPEEIGELLFQQIKRENTPFENQELFLHGLHGVHNVEMPDVKAGIISINSGKGFTQQQLKNGDSVAVISNVFADINNLQVGSIFNIENIIFDFYDFMVQDPINWRSLVENEMDHMKLVDTWELMVVGIFEVNQTFDYSDDAWSTARVENMLQNRIYLPNLLVQEIITTTFLAEQQINPEIQHLNYSDEELIAFMDPSALFMLENPRYLSSFVEAANDLLPRFWMMADLSNNFIGITSAMDSMLWIADGILYTTIGATIVIIGLLTTLFLRDRKHEIGIYMALGEKKRKIISQILLEVNSLAIISITLSVFTGNKIANGISSQLLEVQTIQQMEEFSHLLATAPSIPFIYIPFDLKIFNPGAMSIEEMLAAYDVSLTNETILLLYIICVGTVLISTIPPIVYTLQVKPKKILM